MPSALSSFDISYFPQSREYRVRLEAFRNSPIAYPIDQHRQLPEPHFPAMEHRQRTFGF